MGRVQPPARARAAQARQHAAQASHGRAGRSTGRASRDRKSTRLNSSHPSISYAVFCLKKKTKSEKVTVLASSLNVEVKDWNPALVPALFSRVLALARISFFFSDRATTEIYTLSLHAALPI